MPGSLNDYLKQTQRLIRDSNQELVNPGDIIDYVNRARREVAIRSQCLRALPPTSGPLTTATVTNGGHGYSASPTVTISLPDSPSGRLPFPAGVRATATATVAGGAVQSINVTFGGDGYFSPVVTITDSTGTGATATGTVGGILTFNPMQEVYNFSDIPLGGYPGYAFVYGIRSVSTVYANYRYSLPMYSFSEYQAKIRQFVGQYIFVPEICCQFGQGSAGSLYAYPLPSQQYPMEIDCYCWPSDLLNNEDVEAIPDPWTQAVPFLSAHYAYLELQNLNAADYHRRQFEAMMPRVRDGVQPSRRVNQYGRY